MTGRYLVASMPLGQRGLYGNKNQAELPIDSLTIANNISLAEGSFVKEGGSKKYNSAAATGGINGGAGWNPTPLLQREYIAVGGHIMRATGTTTGVFADIATGQNASVTQTVFVSAGAESLSLNKKLFICNGYNQLKYIDGDATVIATCSIPAADWADSATGAPSFAANHLGRLWVGGNLNDPHRLYYSTQSNHLELSATGAGDAGTLAVYPGAGQKLVGVASFKGFLVAFKYPRGVYYVDSRSPTIANWRVDQINDQVGASGPYAYAIVENDIMFLDTSGNFHLLSIVTEESKQTSNISMIADMAQWFKDNVNMSLLNNARMVYYPLKREVHCAVAGSGRTVNNLRVVIDLNAQEPRFRVSDKDENEAMWIRTNSDNLDELAVGNSSGFVYKLDQTEKSVDGTGYESIFRTSFTDMSFVDPSLSVVEKNFAWLEAEIQPTGAATLSVDILIDGIKTETVNFVLSGAGGVLNSSKTSFQTTLAVLDNSSSQLVVEDQVLDNSSTGFFVFLGGQDLISKKKRIHGKGRRIALQGRQSTANADFNVNRFLVHFKPGSSRL
jgi:hypothetical protein